MDNKIKITLSHPNKHLEEKFAIVDYDCPHEDIFAFKWKLLRASEKHEYAVRNVYRGINPSTGKKIYKACLMHRLITGAKENEYVDHIDGNGLNNCKENLRIVTQTENLINTRKRVGTSSRFKGVSWSSERGLWVAQATIKTTEDKTRHKFVGRFEDEIAAAKAYDKVVYDSWGDLAVLNFPELKQQLNTNPTEDSVG